jgi:hypothetical protein
MLKLPRQVAVLHRQPFLGPSATINVPFVESPSVRIADAFTDPVIGSIPGARSAARPPRCGATSRLFDASGKLRGFFDPSLRQGY